MLDDWDPKDTVTVPDHELMTFLRQHQPSGLDGIWSTQTLELARRFGTTKFDINRWWCLTSSDWVCPACQRPKPRVVRINQHGELMCHLVEHHDHMDRYIQKRLGEYVGKLPVFLATVDSDDFARRCSLAFAAFDPTIVCEDCNNIDSAAKTRVQAHPDFSFTVQDIGQIAIVRSNLPHELDQAKVDEIWRFREQQLRRRCELADRLVELAATNEHWYEPADNASHTDRVMTFARFHFDTAKPLQWRDVHISQFEQVSAGKSPRPSNLRGWRRNKRLKAQRPPNAQEIGWVSETSHAGHYSAVPHDWICPWCRRTKFQIIRPSKQFRWSFAVENSSCIDPSTNEQSGVKICQDCQTIRVQIAKEAMTKPLMVQPLDVSSIIVPEPHAQHGLKSDVEVDAVIERLVERARQFAGVSRGEPFEAP